MRPAFLILLVLVFVNANSYAQVCDCEKELLYIKNFVEQNYAGFGDKQKLMTKNGYDSIVNRLLRLSRDPESRENCLLTISQYLDSFKDNHVQVSAAFDGAGYDSLYISKRRIINIPGKKLKALRRSATAEGIYTFKHDSSYKIAVYKNSGVSSGYTAVIIESKLPSWKKGMIKFEARQIGDSLLKGVLYMRNHLPKVEWFYLGHNSIGGDWVREGTQPVKPAFEYKPVASAKLSDKTLYIKIASFSPSNAKRIDSVFTANKDALNSMPNLVLDLRDNGGGSDFSFTPILPYIYTGPVRTVGVDVLSTEANIAGWKALLSDDDIPESTKQTINTMIGKMEDNRGKLVNIAEDETDSSYQPLPYPRKVAILINRNCASTTEQFLLAAKQSSKVILLGENTDGTLDYSNMRKASFQCMPYTLHYATTRSRRLDEGRGIDHTGIQPNQYLEKGSDWIQEAVKIIEQ